MTKKERNDGKECVKCGDTMTGHEDESSQSCRFCVTASPPVGDGSDHLPSLIIQPNKPKKK